MIQAERISAIVLFVFLLLFALTGYGMTKGIIDRDLSRSLHLSWLGGIGLLAFVIHTAWGIHLTLKRWRLWNAGTKILLAVFYLAVVGTLAYLQFFFEKPTLPSPPASPSMTTEQPKAVFTAETLQPYTGLGGQPAYVAVDGVVYDASSVFKEGMHGGNTAGKDLSVPFHAKHAQEILNKLPVVGSYLP
jgi:predicted heme/steroid binding protein